jgi:branched-chain amino acid transport system ATP-binding protein
MKTGEPLLVVSDLHAGYGSLQAVAGISFKVNEAETVALIGRNGAGKTTSLLAIAGLRYGRFPGSVTLAGVEVSRASSRQIVDAGLAHVPEGHRIFSSLTVEENLLLGAYSRRRSGRKAAAVTMERVFDLFPILRTYATRNAGFLSGGEQQMVAIGRGLASAPRLLMLDEPSMGLAPAVADTIFERVSQIHREDGVTILLVEQRVAEALELSDHGYVLETGHMVLDGPYETLLQDDRVRKSYLGLS